MMLLRVMDGYFKRTRAQISFSAVAVILTASSAFGQAPSVVVDAQQTIGSNFNVPKSVAVAPNGTVYVADTNNNQVVKVTTNLPGASTQTPVLSGQFSQPSALAVDANGDLFVGDYPNFDLLGELLGFPRVTEIFAQNGVLTGNHTTFFQSDFNFNFFLSQPSSLAVDSQNHVYLGLTGGVAPGIYTVAGGNATKLNITGLPNGFTPAALVRNSGTSLYFANSQATSGGVYVVPDTGGAAQPVPTGYFAPENPAGLALDSSGDLFILSQLMVNGTPAPQVFEIPATSTSTPYIIPNAGMGGVTGMGLDPSGNIDVVEVGNGFQGNGLVTQLDYLNPINMGSAAVGTATPGPVIPFNFEFNAAATGTTLAGFQAVTLGDPGSANDVVSAGNGSCANGAISGVTAEAPYICEKPFETIPRYPGTRVSAIEVNGLTASSTPVVLASSPVYETGNSGAQITYPLNQTVTATPLIAPQGVAISGFNQTVYVADFGSGQVYSASGLTGAGLTAVSTGSIALQAPSAVALNGEGDLYVADFGNSGTGKVIVVPTTTGKPPSVVNTGSLLEHPIALAVDYLGNLYIGDAGLNGDTASAGSPGYVVKVPRNGVAAKMTIPYTGPTIIFPQALATDGTNGNLYIGDGGDGVSVAGQVVKVPANGTAASAVTVPNEPAPFNPVGLSVDAAGNLYVLDGSANTSNNVTSTITVVPPSGSSYQVGFVSSSLAAPSAFASSAGGQSFVIANIGNGSTNSLVFLNGNSSTLAFGNVKQNTSANKTATVYNIGNEAFTLGTPAESGAGFSLLNSTCDNGAILNPATSCALNVQFSPTALQPYSGTIAIPSTAYNNGVPALSLSGTGSLTTGSIELPAAASPAGGGRKSFHR